MNNNVHIIAEPVGLMRKIARDALRGHWKEVFDKKLKKTYVTVGKNTGYAYEILSGLSKDDWVAFPYGRHTETGAKTRKGSMSELEEM